jgi:glycosyltransferase involved in cell wall biosynthesis/peptidoglycan/xylan/chitin deacetylase (PgdA/CDA1 family)
MKILFFIDVLTSGGKERRLTELMKGLRKRPDFEFSLALMSSEISYCEVHDLNIPIHYLIRKTKKDLSVFRMLYMLAKSYKPDVIHCWGSMTAVYSVPVCKLLNIKMVNGLITDAPRRQNLLNKHWFRAKLTFPFSDVIVANSKAGLVAYRAPQKKSHYIHNGFNFSRTWKISDKNAFLNRFEITTPFIVGMVANFSSNKDYATFFSAAQMLLQFRKDITFIAIGINTDSHEARKHILPENSSYFRLLGRQTGVESFINAMDVCVLATFTEGISNSILEYMALGKPVIATSGGGTNEIVVDTETGFLVEKENPGDLVKKIDLLLNDEDLRVRMGQAGHERIETMFSIDSMVANYVSLYNTTLAGKPGNQKNPVELFFRETLALILIRIHYLLKIKNTGILSIYFHNPSRFLFERIIKWLLNKNYRFISINELDDMIYKRKPSEKLIFLCFDDGWRGNLDLIEVVEKYQIPITIFVTIDAVKEGNYWWEYALIEGQEKYSGIRKILDFKKLPEKELNEKLAVLKSHFTLERSSVTLDELKKLSENKYVTIGSHTVSHPILPKCSYEVQKKELSESKEILSRLINKEINYFAYPNGSYDDNTVEIARECGYRLAFTTNPGEIITTTADPYTVRRNALYDSGGYYENISKILGIWQKFIFNEADILH